MAVISLKNKTKSRSVLAGNTPDLGMFESIETYTLSSTSATITFSSIPANYSHIQIRVLARTNGSGQDRGSIALKINGDTTSANYSYHCLGGDGASAFATGAASSGTNNLMGGISNIPAANASANIFGIAIIDVLDYANTNKHKTIRTLAGQDQNGTSGRVSLNSGRFGSSSAITSIELIPEYGSFFQYSSFALYGIK